ENALPDEQTLATQREPLGVSQEQRQVFPIPENRVDREEMAQDRAAFSKDGRLHDVVVVLLHEADRLFDLVRIDDIGGVIECTVLALRLPDRQVEGVRLDAQFAVAHYDPS